MGVSTDAYLLFGIPLKDGVVEDFDGEDSETLQGLAYSGKEWNGVIIQAHCCASEPMHFICIKESLVRAHRGGPVRIDLGGLFVGPDFPRWLGQLDAFVAQYKLEKSLAGELGWYLASWWST